VRSNTWSSFQEDVVINFDVPGQAGNGRVTAYA
jgi:hypothetical protein